MPDSSILIIDKDSFVSSILVKKILEIGGSKIVLITKKEPNFLSENIIWIPYGRKPSIPNIEYIKIFTVYNGEDKEFHFLLRVIQETEKNKSKVFFLCHISNAREFVVKNILSLNKNANVVIFGDIFGNEQFNSIRSTINLFLSQAKKTGKILIPKMGIKKTYPVFWQDFLDGLIKIVFSKYDTEKLFYLIPKNPPTELAVAGMIHKADPLVSIDFTLKNISVKNYNSNYSDGEYVLGDYKELKERIKEVYKDGEFLEPFVIALRENSFFGQLINSILIFIIAILLIPLLSVIVFALTGKAMLYIVSRDLNRGDFDSAKHFSKVASINLNIADKATRVVFFEASIIGQENKMSGFSSEILMEKDIAEGIENVLDASFVFSKVFSAKSNNPKEDFDNGVRLLKSSISILQRMEAEDKSGNNYITKTIFTKIEKIDSVFGLVSNTIDNASFLLGFNKEKTYLVLFQNNMEIRPGGGFIGSYGLLTFDRGHIKDFSIKDVYDSDGQLKGHIEPPFAIRRYLPSAHWYLRDSNFDIDFKRSASTSAFFLSEETGKVVDGVIAVDVAFIQKLLRAMGSVYVSDYNETVTPDNFYTLAQSHVEKNFFAGSTQKKDFLRSLFTSMELSLTNKGKIDYIEFLQAIESSIKEKHVLLAISDPVVQNLLSANSISSSLVDTRQEEIGKINDFLGIIDANLGANKANYYIKKGVKQEVEIGNSGSVLEKATIVYKNESKEWPGGDYKNYLRVIVPLGSNLQSISIDGVEKDIIPAITSPLVYEAKNFSSPKGLEVEKIEEEGKTIYGFLVIIPSGTSKIISLSYSLPQKIGIEKEMFSYDHWVFKQPGTDSDQFYFSLSYPPEFKPIFKSDDVKIVDGKVNLIKSILEDIHFQVNFSKK